ncbi:ATP-binding cassette, subfamily B [Ruminococcus sp. YE71]|uniref:ABC transporter ATP-binding protein n=1 Tax=unclassified Ruminococcus TaxID=2608920 RepID=UPI000890BBE4|nr:MULTISPECIES: ABC transporter ATP-binding protein [unclassified Ruminococcus]SDA26266.1 ATP-binding cassette, subfamily B [Ruminococcus sp. YE78]SFW36040.1 ATP-binding cassette, subfamily B [Ruminococcus sp. YE71]
MLRTFKKFFELCGKRERKQFHLSVFLGVFHAFFAAMRIPAVYIVIKAILEGGLSKKQAYISAGIIFASIVLQTVVSMKTTMLQTRAGFNTSSFKRIEIAEHLRYVPMGHLNDEGLGKITSIATNTMESFSGIAARCVIVISKGIITTLVIVLSMFFFEARIALVALITMAVYLAGTEFMIRAESADSDAFAASQDNMVARILEYVRGIAEVRNFDLFGKSITDVDSSIDRFTGYSTLMESVYEVVMFFLNILTKLSGTVMMIMSIAFYLNGSMSLVYAVMMIICSFMIFESLDQVDAFNGLTRTIENCVDKVNEALSSPTMNIDGKELVPESMTITVENVDFSYDKRKIIDEISFEIPERTTAAFVGPSGGGKTTITQLLARFWDVDRGRILLGGTDVREYSYDSLMKNFAFVFQNVYLFSDTIENNIRFGKPDASREDVIKAAKAACCHDFIMALPDGYNTVIGEGGASLSGGERQRISIARAIMKDAPIIILDEATANVDPENETLLMKAVESLTKEKTVIMIAHRLRTVENADQIFVIDHGKIVQHGRHSDLTNEEGIYGRFIGERKKAAGWKLGSHSA